jgi:hypothetical protein
MATLAQARLEQSTSTPCILDCAPHRPATSTNMSFMDVTGVKAGVLTGDAAWGLLKFAKKERLRNSCVQLYRQQYREFGLGSRQGVEPPRHDPVL